MEYSGESTKEGKPEGRFPVTKADGTPKPRAAIYSRISTSTKTGGTQSETSINEQVRRCEQYAELHDYHVVKVYRDEGFSGTNIDRPGYQQMMEELDEWDVVIGYKMDRFHRNVRNAGDWADLLQKREKDFVFMDLQVDTRTAMGMFVFRIMIAFAEMEADVIKERTRAGLAGKKHDGKFVGRPPYGYQSLFAVTGEKRDKGQLTIIEHEAVVVRQLFEWFEMGLNFSQVSREANKNNLPTRQEGKKWSSTTVNNVLTKKPFYQGFHYVDRELKAGSWKAIIPQQ